MLGGGDPGDPFAAAHGVGVKPLIPVAGQPMALWVLRALRDSGRVRRIAYVGPTTPDMDALIDIRVTDTGRLIGNLEAGLAALPEERRALVVTADIPMLTGAQLAEVLDQAPEGAGLVYPIVRREACEAAYPGVKRTYVRFVDGTFTGGNVFLADPAMMERFMPRLQAALAQRKNPVGLARLIGFTTLLRLLTGRLSIEQLHRKVSRILGVPAHALITEHAAIGTDVDQEGDLELAERMLAGGPR